MFNKKAKIYVDMDGVLVNFTLGFAKKFGYNYDELVRNWSPGEWHFEKILKISSGKFYDMLNDGGEEFWSNLPEYEYANDLWDFCNKLAPTYILSAPTQDPGCVKGKVEWLQKKLGKGFSNYILTRHKECCAGPNTYLIDDRDDNVTKFTEAGGVGICFPSYSNKMHGLKDQAFEAVKEKLKSYFLR